MAAQRPMTKDSSSLLERSDGNPSPPSGKTAGTDYQLLLVRGESTLAPREG
jgi:hypothetical protein